VRPGPNYLSPCNPTFNNYKTAKVTSNDGFLKLSTALPVLDVKSIVVFYEEPTKGVVEETRCIVLNEFKNNKSFNLLNITFVFLNPKRVEHVLLDRKNDVFILLNYSKADSVRALDSNFNEVSLSYFLAQGIGLTPLDLTISSIEFPSNRSSIRRFGDFNGNLISESNLNNTIKRLSGEEVSTEK